MRQNGAFLSDFDCERIVVKGDFSEGDPFFADNLCTPQQRLDAVKKLININGLCHVIIRSYEKALVLVLGELLCGNHKNRQIIVYISQCFCEFIPIHLGHHDIENSKVNNLTL